jgi:PAS domain S-box-containing protein
MQEGLAHCKILFDNQNNPVDFVYISVNSAFERLTGLKDVIGKKVTEVIPGIRELSPELFEIYGRVALTGKPAKFVLDFKPMDMHLSISVYSTEKEYFVAVFDNITEQKQIDKTKKLTEEKLAKERNLLRTLIDNMPDRIYAKDTIGRFIISNNALAIRMGLNNPEEIVGKTDFDFLPYELATQFHADEHEVIRSGKPLINREESMDDVSGAHRWNLATKVPLRDNEGIITGIVGLGREITKRKQAELQLAKYAEQLKALNDTKDKFFSIIAHDLRGPFNILLNLSDILTSEIDTLTKDEIKGYNNELRISLTKQYELLINLLDWSKMQDGRFSLKSQIVLLHKEVSNVIVSLALSASNKGIELINNVEENISVFADINMLQLVLRNLISNSIKFTKKNGWVAVAAVKNGMFVEVVVSDNGIGISEEDLNKLFKIDVSYSTKGTENETGTGLGLMLCKEIIEKHNGKIWVESKLNKGSKFIFTLPADDL